MLEKGDDIQLQLPTSITSETVQPADLIRFCARSDAQAAIVASLNNLILAGLAVRHFLEVVMFLTAHCVDFDSV